jgi:hypothetical protein
VAFKTLISGDVIRFVGYAFVDDTDICQIGQDEFTTGEKVATQRQGAIGCLGGGMRATGGAIVPEKSVWSLIDFVWTEGKWSYASEEESRASISVRDFIAKFSTVCLHQRLDTPWESALLRKATRPHNLVISDQWLRSGGIRLVLIIFLAPPQFMLRHSKRRSFV